MKCPEIAQTKKSNLKNDGYFFLPKNIKKYVFSREKFDLFRDVGTKILRVSQQTLGLLKAGKLNFGIYFCTGAFYGFEWA